MYNIPGTNDHLANPTRTPLTSDLLKLCHFSLEFFLHTNLTQQLQMKDTQKSVVAFKEQQNSLHRLPAKKTKSMAP